MENSKKKSSYQVFFVVILLLFIGWLGYNCNQNVKIKKNQQIIEAVTNKKNDLLVDLSNLNNQYSDEIISNPAARPIVIIKRNKVLKLIDNVITTDSKSAEIFKEKIEGFRNETNSLELKNNIDKQEVATSLIAPIKNENDSLLDEPVVIIFKEENKSIRSRLNKTIESINNIPKKTENKIEPEIDVANLKIGVENLKINPIQINKKGEQSETQNAKETDGLRINFIIPENKLAKTGTRTYFIQIYNENGKMVFQKGKAMINGKLIEYSLKSDIDYKNKYTRFNQNILGNAYSKGTYKVKIFDYTDLVSESNFTLM
jgi:hypothetical protein